MLKIKAPIKTTLNPDLCESNESFARRIIANYDQINEFITREDLFHVVTQPPEIFMMGDGASSFLSETEIHNTQLKKVEIINNLMNRILVSADGNLTYQDEVYITNVLHKLGIRDERTFMKKVYELTEETRENSRLIETYWQNRQELSQMISYYRMQKNEGDVTQVTREPDEILHLHEDVFKRWMTAAVYRMQNNFRTTTDSSTFINNESYRMTEEQRLSQQILLQRLRESVRGESLPLVYRHDNYYEQPGEDERSASTEAVAEQIASAVLLSLVDNLYENISSRTETVQDRFYRTENAYYGAADHVFERMEGNTAYIISEHRAGDMISQLTENIRSEYSAVNDILQHYYSGGDEITQNMFEADISEAAEMILPGVAEASPETGSTEIHVDQRNSLEQQLFQMNIKNEQRRHEYMANLERLARQQSASVGGPLDDEGRRRESQFALEHPEEFRRQAMERVERETDFSDEAAQEFIDSLPVHSREVLKVIDKYIENPQMFFGTRTVSQNAETLLVREQIEAERDEVIRRESQRISETIESSTDTERNITNRVQAVEQTVGRVVPETIRLVHKVNDVTVDEETIASLRREISQIKSDTSRIETRVENHENVVEKQVNNVNTTVLTEENTDKITRMIQDNINSQIGNITSKVYSRLERQLMSERRRRGM
ncbi:MAG: hypothetical protein K6B14_03180 [Lachnospiraceae bacterium]|nr:hypothetical protein [Lachnospiraceae bacterium]